MSHRERVIAALAAHPGLDDDELSRTTGIRPRQQVNQICRRLETEGALRRVSGPDGKIVNMLTAGSLQPSHPVPGPPVATVPLGHKAIDDRAFRVADPARTLFIIPCSGLKSGGGMAAARTSILDSIPTDLAVALQHARARRGPMITLDQSALRPAWQRYDGAFYRAAAPAIEGALHRGQHILIISGGYGIVRAGDAIGTYEAVFRPAQWPRGLLEDVILAYAERHRLVAVRAIASATTGYAALIRNDLPWRRAGIADSCLITPERTKGAMKKAPGAQGEALVALLDGHLTPDWQSSHGLRLEAVSLL
jgi:hypothetical protein